MISSNYPKWPIRLLKKVCPDHLFEEIEGDVLQTYHIDLRQLGQASAKRRLVWNVIRYCRPGIILRNRWKANFHLLYLYRHFFAIFFRTTKRDLGYSSTNILGLTLAITCFIFIGLWSFDELSFDTFHANRENIYQVLGRHRYPDGTFVEGGMPGPLATALKGLSNVEETSRMNFTGRQLLHGNSKSFYEEGVYADASLLSIFTFHVIEGDRQRALNDRSSIIISRKIAQKYFGNESPVGQILKLNNKSDLAVKAVFEDLPQNSSLKFDYVLPYELYATQDAYNNEWGAWTGGFTYIKISNSTKVTDLENQIAEKFTKPNIWARWDSNVELFLFPLKKWHLNNNFTDGVQDGGRINYVIIFSAVGVFILLMACINFTNLTIARATKRAKEIGVRKVIGAHRSSLFIQFLSESILIVALATLLSLIVVTLALPLFNQLTGKEIILPYREPAFYILISGVILIVGFIAGCYPAILPSSFNVMEVLKGKFHVIKVNTLRRALIVFQFTLSVTLIVCCIMATRQIQYIQNKNLGFDRQNIIYFNLSEQLSAKVDAFKNETMKSPLINAVSEADTNPMEVQRGMVLSDNAWPGKTKEDNIIFRWIQCDHDFIPALGFNIIAGRNFSKSNAADSVSYIINEEAARQMKLTHPVGQSLSAPHPGKIIGVVRDFHSAKLQFAIQPVIFAMKPVRSPLLFVKYEAGRTKEVIPYVESIYKKFEPDFPLEWKIMNDALTQQYKDEQMINKIANLFTGIAIVISCMGLLGLVTYTAEMRGKEIGIRKVMGASIFQILTLLSKDFLMLIAIAFLIGIPLGWIASEQYLKDYAFRINMDISTIILTALLLAVATLLAVSFQSVKAAAANPNKTLRSE
jgi:putative ABC transport system permease protein